MPETIAAQEPALSAEQFYMVARLTGAFFRLLGGARRPGGGDVFVTPCPVDGTHVLRHTIEADGVVSHCPACSRSAESHACLGVALDQVREQAMSEVLFA